MCPGILAAGIVFARAAAAATFTVTVAPGGSLTFDPSSQTIGVGDTVTWVWGFGIHSTTSGTLVCLADDRWNSGLQSNPYEFSVTFTSPGTFSYFCSLHCGNGMTGEIIVQEPTGTPTPTSTPTTVAPTSTPTSPPPPATATPIGPGVVPTLSPSMLALFAAALGAAALLLIRRS